MSVIDRQAETHVEEATEDDVRGSLNRALADEGITLDQLRAEAETGHFSSLDRRLTWILARALEEA